MKLAVAASSISVKILNFNCFAFKFGHENFQVRARKFSSSSMYRTLRDRVCHGGRSCDPGVGVAKRPAWRTLTLIKRACDLAVRLIINQFIKFVSIPLFRNRWNDDVNQDFSQQPFWATITIHARIFDDVSKKRKNYPIFILIFSVGRGILFVFSIFLRINCGAQAFMRAIFRFWRLFSCRYRVN